jgi:hypothetical protein
MNWDILTPELNILIFSRFGIKLGWRKEVSLTPLTLTGF